MNIFGIYIAEPASDGTIDTVKLISIIALALLAVIFMILSSGERKYDTRSIVYAAICIALSFALSFIKIGMPFGGSVTLASFLPILIYSYFYGPVKGLFAGIIYGLLQFIQDSWFLTPTQFLLDYILAFSGIAFAGMFKNIIKSKTGAVVTGAVCSGLFRYVMHVLAGLIFFNAGFVTEGIPNSSALIYSAVYNLYVVVDIAIAIGLLVYLVKSGYYTKIAEKLDK